MRRQIKKQIKSIIQTMWEAHSHVVVLIQNRQIAEANNLLAQCQECAKYIGESIEESEGFNTPAVSYLETYCEQLYSMSRTMDKKGLKRLKVQLDGNLHSVEYELDKNIPLDKMKIVFMPYKASMWDCMESVWEAADKDEQCEVYVIPVPYYERNQDGGIEKECYEGALFPREVPIVSYKSFSLEKEHPDVIYIHNPYDAANYVTSVHPDYYSSELKKYTDVLVYIPYYILGNGPMPEAHQKLPAYMYADKIIVQDLEKAESLSDYVPEDKIAVIGSPKVDRLLKLERKKKEIIENYISQAWREKIAGKKVILFNVSITGILQYSKYAMNKIRYVISTFEEREDVVLLWRPHPLVEATLKSMRPEMHKEYMEIKNTFVHKGKGILDESADAGIATVISDAYVGENSSSLVHYFGVLGKPVFYINWIILEYKNESRDFLFFRKFLKEDKSIFFVPLNKGLGSALYQFNLESGMINRVREFPGIPDNIWGCYIYGLKVENKIVFVPYNLKDIYIYDIEKKHGIKLILSEADDYEMLFGGAVEYNGKVFLIPECYPAIVAIDIENFEVCEFKECIAPFLSEEKNKRLFTLAYLKVDQYLYLASVNESKMIKFNMEDGNYEIKEIGKHEYGFGHMIFDGTYFWLIAYTENCVVRWDEKTEDIKEYVYPINDQRLSKEEIWGLLLDKGKEIIVCAGSSLDIILIDKLSGKYRYDKKMADIFGKKKGKSDNLEGNLSYACLLDTETAVLIENKYCSVNIWNMQTDQWRHFTCRLSKNELLDLEKKQIEKYCLAKSVPYSLSENDVPLVKYVDYIAEGNMEIFKNSCNCYRYEEGDKLIGDRIHEYIRG